MESVIDPSGIRVRPAPGCFLCGRTGRVLHTDVRDPYFGAPGTWAIRACPSCRLAWLDPRPLGEDIRLLYERYGTHADDGGDPPGRRAVKACLRDAVYGYRRSGPARRLAGWMMACFGQVRHVGGGTVMWLRGERPGRLLDAGCGNGGFLEDMRALGWTVAGVEPDPRAVRVARRRGGLEVHEGTLEDAPFPPGSFDAVTAGHVVEHLPDPVAFLDRCRRLLRPGGRLVVTTPNLEGACRRRFGVHWRGWEVPRHLFVFSPSALAASATKAGLAVRHVDTTARGAAWFWRMGRALRSGQSVEGDRPPPSGGGRKLEAALHGFLQNFLAWIRRCGEEIVLIARNPDPGGTP